MDEDIRLQEAVEDLNAAHAEIDSLRRKERERSRVDDRSKREYRCCLRIILRLP